MKPSSHLPTGYAAGRRSFLAAAEAAGAHVRSYQNPLRGPDGEQLFTDVAWIGSSDARRVLITMSATHGVEGFAGSGIQTGSLRAGLYGALPESVAVLMIHALNPYGFAWLRRTSEDGVDVARNFVDFSKPLPANPFYDAHAVDLVPDSWTGEERARADARLRAVRREQGPEAFTAQLARGQYSHWFAPFFGGHAPTWSNRTLRSILRSYLSAARDVLVVDYHTGLGANGTGQLITSVPPDAESHHRAVDCWSEKVVSVYSRETVAFQTTGDHLRALEQEVPQARIAAAVYEFGTLHPGEVLTALRGDHWLHAHGDLRSPLAREIKSKIRDAFFCDTDRWRESVFDLGAVAEHEAMAALRAA